MQLLAGCSYNSTEPETNFDVSLHKKAVKGDYRKKRHNRARCNVVKNVPDDVESFVEECSCLRPL